MKLFLEERVVKNRFFLVCYLKKNFKRIRKQSNPELVCI